MIRAFLWFPELDFLRIYFTVYKLLYYNRKRVKSAILSLLEGVKNHAA